MKGTSKRTGEVWSPLGSHQLEIDRSRAPGPGHVMKTQVWCSRCQADRDRKGGRRVGGLFFCALHGERGGR